MARRKPSIAIAEAKDAGGGAGFKTETVHAALADKGFDPGVISRNGPNLSAHFNRLVLREADQRETLPERALLSFNDAPTSDIVRGLGYTGSPEENALIDRAIKDSERKGGLRDVSGAGATRTFGNTVNQVRVEIRNTPIVVLGTGPAGILATRMLSDLGFTNIKVLNKSNESGGIWKQKNVNRLSKNNPFDLTMERSRITVQHQVAAAPGPASTIVTFLNSMNVLPTVIGTVRAVRPSQSFGHQVEYDGPDGQRRVIYAPIVINTLGVGKPKDPSQGKMAGSAKDAGIRWQQEIDDETAKKLVNQPVVLIGLGNSTAEMMVQFEKHRRAGLKIDYKILTHYPKAAVEDPYATVKVGSESFRVFRDLQEPNLTKFAGDLDIIRAAYYQALFEKRIITDVKEWKRTENGVRVLGMSLRGKREVPADGAVEIPCQQLYTLIGYEHSYDEMENYGIESYRGARVDYDGEVQADNGSYGRDRIYPGYFALGAILKSPTNPNAEVIPGIFHRLYDLSFTAIVRASEYNGL